MKTLTFTKKIINGDDVYIDETGIFIIKKRYPYFRTRPEWDLYVQNHVYCFKYDRIYNFPFKSKKEIIEEVQSLIDFIDVYTPMAYEFNDEQIKLLIRTYKEGEDDASN